MTTKPEPEIWRGKVRREPFYLSYPVWRALRLLAKAQSDEVHQISADQLADEMLADLIAEKYPQLVQHMRAADKLEREVIKTLGGNK
jgi:hypothetical protein